MRRQPPRQTEEQGALRAQHAPQPPRIVVDLRLVVGDEHLPRLGPLERIKVRHVLRLQRRERVLPKLYPIVNLGHGSIVRRSSGGVPRL